ncbi:MAG: glycosyltransferase [Nitrospiraceae bacterium]|nr:glycosyltransferase [Nitrospiraceae bacterium]
MVKSEVQTNKRILFVTLDLGGGGAERVLAHLLKNLDRGKFQPSVVVLKKDAPSYEVPEDVDVNYIRKTKALDFFRLAFSLARLIREERPSAIISFLTYTNYLTAFAKMLSGSKVPLLLNERTTISEDLKGQRFAWLKRKLVSYFYPKANCIIAVSKGVMGDLVSNYCISEGKCSVIYNPVDLGDIETKAMEDVDHPWFKDSSAPVITACGRLGPEKNYPLLLKSLVSVLKQTDIRLAVVGDGVLRTELESMAEKLGIRKNVLFLGHQLNPYKYMSRSRIFALSSNYEGFPNVLLEAMACGVPVISTRCPSGPGEIITDRVNGLLVPPGDEGAMAKAILELAGSGSMRRELGENGRKRAGDFAMGRMMAEYEKVFLEAAGCSGN